MAENCLRHFHRNVETVEHSCYPSAEPMPAVPLVTDNRLHLATAEIIKVQRPPLLLTSKNPFAVPVLLLMSR